MDFSALNMDSRLVSLMIVVAMVCFLMGGWLTLKEMRLKKTVTIGDEKAKDMRLALDRYPLRPIYNIFAPLLVSLEPKLAPPLYETFKLAGRPAFVGRIATGKDVFATFVAGAIFGGLIIGFFAALGGAPPLAILLFTIGGSGLVYFIFTTLLSGEANKRQTSIDNEFPYFLDLAVMTVGAGAKVEDAFDLYSADRQSSPLTEELILVSNELKSGSVFMDAMLNLRNRTDALSIDLTVNEIINSREAGTPVADVMRVASKDLRDIRSSNAEQMGEKLKSKIIVPSLLMAGSAMIIILGPALIELADSDLF